MNASIAQIGRQLGNLNAIRQRAYDQEGFVSSTVSEYDALIQSLIDLSQEMAEATGNTDMIASTRALAAFSSAKEYESIQRAVISAALADGKKLSQNDWRFANSASRSYRTSLEQFKQIYGLRSPRSFSTLSSAVTKRSCCTTSRLSASPTPKRASRVSRAPTSTGTTPPAPSSTR